MAKEMAGLSLIDDLMLLAELDRAAFDRDNLAVPAKSVSLCGVSLTRDDVLQAIAAFDRERARSGQTSSGDGGGVRSWFRKRKFSPRVCATFWSEPVSRLSTKTTRCPSATRESHRCDRESPHPS
jgi:hypothetical protein